MTNPNSNKPNIQMVREALEFGYKLCMGAESCQQDFVKAAEALHFLEQELAFYRENCVVLEEGAEPSEGDIGIFGGEHYEYDWCHRHKEYAWKSLTTNGARFNKKHDCFYKVKIIQRAGKPVIIKGGE